jgi:hypothetical protein
MSTTDTNKRKSTNDGDTLPQLPASYDTEDAKLLEMVRSYGNNPQSLRKLVTSLLNSVRVLIAQFNILACWRSFRCSK